MSPILSWLRIAVRARRLATSAASSAFERVALPYDCEPDTSTMNSTVSSRSSL